MSAPSSSSGARAPRPEKWIPDSTNQREAQLRHIKDLKNERERARQLRKRLQAELGQATTDPYQVPEADVELDLKEKVKKKVVEEVEAKKKEKKKDKKKRKIKRRQKEQGQGGLVPAKLQRRGMRRAEKKQTRRRRTRQVLARRRTPTTFRKRTAQTAIRQCLRLQHQRRRQPKRWSLQGGKTLPKLWNRSWKKFASALLS